VSGEPSVFCVGGTHASVAVPVVGGGSGDDVTVMAKPGSAAEAFPSLTLMTMPAYVPTLPVDGVPVSWPVAMLNVAHEGLF